MEGIFESNRNRSPETNLAVIQVEVLTMRNEERHRDMEKIG